jgi:PKD repeat protein
MAIIASFTFAKASGRYLDPENYPAVVNFTDTTTESSTGGDVPDRWMWDFGDGWTSSAQHPQHTYTTPGPYTVTLQASKSSGSVTTTIEGWGFNAETKDSYPGSNDWDQEYADFLADLWTTVAGDQTARYSGVYMGLFGPKQAFSYRNDWEFDLSSYSEASNIAEIIARNTTSSGGDIQAGSPQITYNGADILFDTTNTSYTFAVNVNASLGSADGSVFVTDAEFVKLPEPSDGTGTGWVLGMQLRVTPVSSKDTVQVTVPGELIVGFKATPRTGNDSINAVFTALSAPAYSISSRVWESNDVEFSNDEFPTKTFP